MKTWRAVAFLLGGAALIACSSSGSGSRSDSTSSGSTTTTSSAGGGTGQGGSGTTSTTGTTTTSGSGGAGGTDCTTACVNNNMAGFQKFEGYELKECGCAQGSPCFNDCKTNCPSTIPKMDDPCGKCLLAEAAKKTSSACTTKAATMDCLPDSMCSPFIQCALGC